MLLHSKSYSFSYQESNATSNYGIPNNPTAHAKSYSPANAIADIGL